MAAMHCRNATVLTAVTSANLLFAYQYSVCPSWIFANMNRIRIHIMTHVTCYLGCICVTNTVRHQALLYFRVRVMVKGTDIMYVRCKIQGYYPDSVPLPVKASLCPLAVHMYLCHDSQTNSTRCQIHTQHTE